MRLFALIAIVILSLQSESNANPTPAPKRTIDWAKFESAVILKTYRGKNTYICSAVLLSDTLGITTAHCIEKSDRNEVVLGISLTDPHLKTIGVNQKSIRIHPKYKPKHSLYDYDLATFTLKEGAELKYYPTIPKSASVKLETGNSFDRVGFGLRNNQNVRTWTEVFFEKKDEQTLFFKDSLSVIGDSGSALFKVEGDKISLFAIHSTLVEEGHIAAPSLLESSQWIFNKNLKK